MSSVAVPVQAGGETAGYLPFLARLDADLRKERRTGKTRGLLIVHISNLNRINTAAGYRSGQRLATGCAAEFESILRDCDWMMRLADDRYAIVLDRVRNSGHIILAANRVAQIAASLPAAVGAGAVPELTVGAAIFPEHGNTPELLLRSAELAVEAATRGHSSFALYRPDVSRQLTDDWDMESALSSGIGNDEFELYYQPLINARSLQPCGAEALMRWHNGRFGHVPPDRFIPLAEATGHIEALTNFAVHSAARDARAWQRQLPKVRVSVNLSPTVIEHGDIVTRFEQAAAIWGVGLDSLKAEVTENGIMSTGGAALRVLRELREAGVRVSIDDFGTGNSSLAYFKDIPADELKIDKSFVFAMLDDGPNDQLIQTIIDLAHGFDLKVVAEGVETERCAERLREFGCDVLQGYHYSRPLPRKEFIAWLGEAAEQSNPGHDASGGDR
jgi:predicted signal transduction protein with EAL and GGDEF domain